MASRTPRLLAVTVLAVVAVRPLAGQAPTALRLTFAEAVARAAGGAPGVTLAGLRSDEARARVRQARAPLLPNLSATGSWVTQTVNPQTFGFQFPGIQLPRLIGPFDLYDGRLHVTQTLLDFASRSRVRASRSQLASTQSDSSLATEAAVQVTSLSYLRAVRARAVVAAREADSVLAAELVQLAQAQKDAEVGTTIDVTRARTQLFASAGALVVARNQLERARIDLVRSLGLPSDTPVELTDTLSADLARADLPVGRDSLVQFALAHRPDLESEEARRLAAQRGAAAISAERLPRLDLSANYGAIGLSPATGRATRQLALQVTVPILDGFRREGRHAEQEAVVQASAIRAAELRRQIAADVDGATLDLGSARQQQAIARERLQLAEEELDQARERFKAGVAGNIEVIDAQVSLIRARDADIDARFASATAQVALARAAGVARQLH